MKVCERNREALSRILFVPRYGSHQTPADLTTTILGQTFDYPVGIAPLGLDGLIWPHAAVAFAEVAALANVPIVLSTFSTTSLERVAAIAGGNAWFQLYPPSNESIEIELLDRIAVSGYQTLVVTVDTPTAHRRAHDIRNGLSVPPRLDTRAVLQILTRPRWALEQWRHRPLAFENLERYVPSGSDLASRGAFLVDIMEGRVDTAWVSRLRDRWRGRLVVKGVMHPADAERYLAVGVDGLVVSNHGGRQLDAAPATADVLPHIRQAVGSACPLIVDGGVRSGLDVARFLALGADLVLCGRAFAWGAAAAGSRGVHHVMGILSEELRIAMAQVGCGALSELHQFLRPSVLPREVQ